MGALGRSPPLCASTQLAQQDSNQPEKTDNLREEEPEAHGCYRVGLDEAYVHQRLHDAGKQNRDCKRINRGAAHVAGVQAEDDRAKNREILDAVCMCPHSPLVPVRSLDVISAEVAYRHTT